MTTIERLAAGFALACMWGMALPAGAQARAEQAGKAVDEAMEAAYSQALAEYDQAIAKAPRDAALAVSRCEFIAQFNDEEGGRYLERSGADLEACNGKLDPLRGTPEVQVHDFEGDWEDDALARGDALLATSANWPLPLRRRLATDLAARYRYGHENSERGKQVAIQAAELGDDASIGDAAVALIGDGEIARAQALLDHARPAESDWTAAERVRAAMGLPDKRAARDELLRQQRAGRDVEPAVAALARLRAGDLAAAKASMAEATGKDEDVLDARFRVAMATGDRAAAAKAVRMQDTAHFAENTGRFLALVEASPASLLRPSLWPSLFIVLACLAFYLLLPGALLVPVHYRGLARRVAGRAQQPVFEPVRLRHAWAAVAIFLLLPMCVLAVIDPGHFGEVFAKNARPDPARMLELIAWSDAIGLLLFAPMVMRFARGGQFRPASALHAWKQVLLAYGITMLVGVVLALLQRWVGVDATTEQIRMVHDLINRHDTRWDGILALSVVALLVPVWEEFSFRGMLLGGMSRHIRFGWANTWQALLFAACHDDWPRFPYYLVMGLLAGWLVRRTGKLAPAIFLHMAINSTAFFLIRN